MSVILRTDSDRYVHQLWPQQQAASCAVASMWMARNQAKRMTFLEDEWALAWRMFHQVVQGMTLFPTPPAPAPQSLSPAAHQNNQRTFGNMFSIAGTFMDQLARAFVTDGLKVTHKTSFAPGNVVTASWLSDSTPAVVLLGWYNGNRRNGGHFIVASRVTRSGKIVYLDPWGGQLTEMGPGPGYQASGRFEQIIYISA